MCGIAGLVGDFIPGLMTRMNAAQGHRGPDGCGAFERPDSQAALGHVRLAVLDLSSFAAQPMTSPDGRYTLAYNGEVYNFADLRAALSDGGPPFRSTGDTEVVLRGLIRRGRAFVERLNGMFAFAFWDDRERELLLVRDPLGIKPLYYAEPVPGSLLFASEIKALCAHPAVRREPDFHTIEQHLTFGHSCSDRTALSGIRRLPAGTMLSWTARTRQPVITRYWQPRFSEPATGEIHSDVERLRHALVAATQRQLVSDVPIGSFLSGGLDSSLITAIAAGRSHKGAPFRSYTISYPRKSNGLDRAHDDAPHARKMAARLGLEFHEIEIGPQVADLLPQLIHHLDEPLADPAVITCFLISRLAREHGTKVMLSGQGADELFGGYPRYVALRSLRWIDRVPAGLRSGLASGARFIPGALGGRIGAALRRARRVLLEVHRSPDERFLAYCMATRPDGVLPLLAAEPLERLRGSHSTDDCLLRMQSSGLTGEDRYLERDLSVYLPNHNLLYTDKMGMAVGMESRVPFLDLELVGMSTAMAAARKLDPVPKAVLRAAARGLIPDVIIDRPKAGFGAPYRHWLRHDLGAMWNDLMSAESIRQRGWLRPEGVLRIRRQSQAGRVDYYMLQWALLTLELWARQFLDRNPAADSTWPASFLRREQQVRVHAA